MAPQERDVESAQQDVLNEVKQLLANIQFGSVEILVHNGQIVQIELREKKRYPKN